MALHQRQLALDISAAARQRCMTAVQQQLRHQHLRHLQHQQFTRHLDQRRRILQRPMTALPPCERGAAHAKKKKSQNSSTKCRPVVRKNFDSGNSKLNLCHQESPVSRNSNCSNSLCRFNRSNRRAQVLSPSHTDHSSVIPFIATPLTSRLENCLAIVSATMILFRSNH